MRALLPRPFRPVAMAALLLGAGLASSCSEWPLGSDRGTMASIRITPHWTRENAAIYRSLTDFNMGATHVRVALVRPPSDTLKDTTVAVTPTDTMVFVDMEVALQGTEELLSAGLEIRSGTLLLFAGTVSVLARVGVPTERPPVLVPVWVGPGSTATRVAINQPDTTIGNTQSIALSATAFTAANVPVTDPEFTSRFAWSVLEPSLGSVTAAGIFTGAGTNGVARVVVRTPNLLADTVAITLSPLTLPAAIEIANHQVVVNEGATASAGVAVRSQGGSILPNAAVTYTSRTPAVATVDGSGTITGVAKGQAIIVAAVTSNPTIVDSLLAIVAKPGSPVVLTSLARFRLPADTQFTVSVFVDMRTSPKKLGSAAIDVEWSTAQLTYVSHANGSGVSPTVNSSGTGSGKLSLAMADVAGLSGRVEMLRITFRTTTGTTTGSLSLVSKEINGADYSDLLPVTTTVVQPLRVP